MLVSSAGSIVDVAAACEGSASYWLSVDLNWSDRTHPGTPSGSFWYPLAAQAHDARCATLLCGSLRFKCLQLCAQCCTPP
jgi:hypothetical protein